MFLLSVQIFSRNQVIDNRPRCPEKFNPFKKMAWAIFLESELISERKYLIQGRRAQLVHNWVNVRAETLRAEDSARRFGVVRHAFAD
jgi:hypothetical protein